MPLTTVRDRSSPPLNGATKTIYVYKDAKIIFVKRKVADMQ